MKPNLTLRDVLSELYDQANDPVREQQIRDMTLRAAASRALRARGETNSGGSALLSQFEPWVGERLRSLTEREVRILHAITRTTRGDLMDRLENKHPALFGILFPGIYGGAQSELSWSEPIEGIPEDERRGYWTAFRLREQANTIWEFAENWTADLVDEHCASCGLDRGDAQGLSFHDRVKRDLPVLLPPRAKAPSVEGGVKHDRYPGLQLVLANKRRKKTERSLRDGFAAINTHENAVALLAELRELAPGLPDDLLPKVEAFPMGTSVAPDVEVSLGAKEQGGKVGVILDCKPRREAQALGVLAEHPDWTDTKIARTVGVSRTTLYDWPTYKKARGVIREGGRSKYRQRPTGRPEPDTFDDTQPDTDD